MTIRDVSIHGVRNICRLTRLRTTWDNKLLHAAMTIAAAACLSQSLASPLSEPRGFFAEENEPTSLFLKLRLEIPLEHPLLMPQDYAWLLRLVIAVHPDGRRAVVLIPDERRIEVRTRTASGFAERNFLLAWVDLSTGRLSGTRDFSFSQIESFGFTMTADGGLFCVIAGQKVMILDETFSTVDWTHSQLSGTNGEKRFATSCTFKSDASAVLVTFDHMDGSPWQWRSSLMLWNWKEKSASLIHWDRYIVAAHATRGSSVLLYRSLPNFLFRFRLEEMDWRSRRVNWESETEGFQRADLVLSENHIFRVDRIGGRGSDSPTLLAIPERFRDSDKLSENSRIRVAMRHEPGSQGVLNVKGWLWADDRVLVWRNGTPSSKTEYRERGLALHWPLCVAHAERWFAVRDVKYSYVEDSGALSWEFNRISAFSLSGSKRRLYTSEKFGPKEAITGLALSRDDKTLLVSTSSRLLVYSVEENFAK